MRVSGTKSQVLWKSSKCSNAEPSSQPVSPGTCQEGSWERLHTSRVDQCSMSPPYCSAENRACEFEIRSFKVEVLTKLPHTKALWCLKGVSLWGSIPYSEGTVKNLVSIQCFNTFLITFFFLMLLRREKKVLSNFIGRVDYFSRRWIDSKNRQCLGVMPLW